MRVRLTGQQLRGGFAHSLGVLAARKRRVVEEEAQQVQILGSNLAAQKEVVAQAAIEILDQGAGSVEAGAEFTESLLDGIELIMELLVEFGGTHPIGLGGGGHGLQREGLTESGYGHSKALGQGVEFLIETLGKGQQGIALVDQGAVDWPDAFDIEPFQGLQRFHDEVIESLAGRGVGAGQGEDIVAHPIAQGAHVVRQTYGGGFPSPCLGHSGRQATPLSGSFGLVHFLL